jgi:hypothetical protein
MSKKNKNESLFEVISESELAVLSGGGNVTATGGNGGNSGSINHSDSANVKGGKYKTGDGGDGGDSIVVGK